MRGKKLSNPYLPLLYRIRTDKSPSIHPPSNSLNSPHSPHWINTVNLISEQKETGDIGDEAVIVERERGNTIGKGGIIGGFGEFIGGLLGRNKDGSRDIRDSREVKDFEKINKKI